MIAATACSTFVGPSARACSRLVRRRRIGTTALTPCSIRSSESSDTRPATRTTGTPARLAAEATPIAVHRSLSLQRLRIDRSFTSHDQIGVFKKLLQSDRSHDQVDSWNKGGTQMVHQGETQTSCSSSTCEEGICCSAIQISDMLQQGVEPRYIGGV